MALLVSPSPGSAHTYPHIGIAKLPITNCTNAIPQRSLLGPVLFSVCLYQIAQIAPAFGLNQQRHADDTQLYIAMSKLQKKPGRCCLGWKSVRPNSKFGSAIMISSSSQKKPTSSYSVSHIERILLHLFPP